MQGCFRKKDPGEGSIQRPALQKYLGPLSSRRRAFTLIKDKNCAWITDFGTVLHRDVPPVPLS